MVDRQLKKLLVKFQSSSTEDNVSITSPSTELPPGTDDPNNPKILERRSSRSTIDPKSKNHQLLSAGRSGDLRALQGLLQHISAVDVETKDPDFFNFTPLIWASHNEHVPCVQMLLQQGNADVTARDDKGGSALIYAAKFGSPEIVELLLQHVAAKQENESASFDKAAVLDAQHELNGETPLMYAVANGYSDIVRLLVKAGANVDVADKSGKTALDRAKDNFKTELVELLEKHSKMSNGK